MSYNPDNESTICDGCGKPFLARVVEVGVVGCYKYICCKCEEQWDYCQSCFYRANDILCGECHKCSNEWFNIGKQKRESKCGGCDKEIPEKPNAHFDAYCNSCGKSFPSCRECCYREDSTKKTICPHCGSTLNRAEHAKLKLKIPRQVSIGPYTFDISFVEHLRGGKKEALRGQWRFDPLAIYIDNEYKPKARFETFIHEIVDASDSLFNLGLNHHQVIVISSSVTQALEKCFSCEKYLVDLPSTPRIPSYVRIGYFVFNVSLSEEIKTSEGSNRLGQWSLNPPLIEIDAGLTVDFKWGTFIHEVVEVCDAIYDVDIPHTNIIVLSNCIAQALEGCFTEYGEDLNVQ
jgi:hypothetical protein